jgi:hypothetical protein
VRLAEASLGVLDPAISHGFVTWRGLSRDRLIGAANLPWQAVFAARSNAAGVPPEAAGTAWGRR